MKKNSVLFEREYWVETRDMVSSNNFQLLSRLWFCFFNFYRNDHRRKPSTFLIVGKLGTLDIPFRLIKFVESTPSLYPPATLNTRLDKLIFFSEFQLRTLLS